MRQWQALSVEPGKAAALTSTGYPECVARQAALNRHISQVPPGAAGTFSRLAFAAPRQCRENPAG